MDRTQELNILIIEDQDEDLALIRRELTKQGFTWNWRQVQTTDELRDALESDWDVILADMVLPRLNVDIVLDLVPAPPEGPPVIVISGNVGEEVAVETMRKGAIDYIMKDRLKRLGPAIERALADVARLREEQRLIEELHLRNRAFAALTNGVVITDARKPGHPIIYCNPGFERVTGYTAAEILGRNCRFLQGDDLDQPERQQIRQALQDANPCHVLLRNYRRDGTLFWNELHLAPVFSDDGKLTHFIGVQTDVTALKNAQAEATQHQNALAHFARVSTAGEMVSGIAHELNQPLTTILNATDTLKLKLNQGITTPFELEPLADRAFDQARRAGQIIQRLRSLIRRSDPRRLTVDLRDVVTRAVELVRMEHQFDGIDILWNPPADLPLVEADTVQIEQVLLNLIRNACEAQMAQAEARFVRIRGMADASGSVIVRVEDNGDTTEIGNPEQFFCAVLHNAGRRNGNRPGPLPFHRGLPRR